MNTVRVLLVAGGTGGHCMPAVAVAEELLQQNCEVAWLGRAQSFEQRIANQFAIKFFGYRMYSFRKQSWFRKLIMPWLLGIAFLQAWRILKAYQPNVLIAFGGYVTVPAALAAYILRVPFGIHEQNALVGLANRLLAKFATRVFCAFPGSFAASANVIVVGNPVRQLIWRVAKLLTYPMTLEKKPLHILLLGGSQGSDIINMIAPLALSQLAERLPIFVWHQTGNKRLEQTKLSYQQARLPAKVSDYIDDMSVAYSWCDLIISRAGASTLAEICAVGVASVLIPYAAAVDDHQMVNAQTLQQAGAATVIAEHSLTSNKLYETLLPIALDYQLRNQMACAAKQLAQPSAAMTLVSNLLLIAK